MICSQCGRPTEGTALSEGAVSAVCTVCLAGGISRTSTLTPGRVVSSLDPTPLDTTPRKKRKPSAVPQVK